MSPRQFLVGTCTNPHSRTQTHTCMYAWISVTQHPTPYIPCSPQLTLPPFIIHCFLILCSFPWSLFSLSPSPIHTPNPLSHHYILQHSSLLFHSSHNASFPLSFDFDDSFFPPPRRSPIISDGTASKPLMFTKLTVNCQDCAAGHNVAVTHLAEPRAWRKARVGCWLPVASENKLSWTRNDDKNCHC